MGRRVKMLQTHRQTDRQTYRTSDEAGPRGAFAPNNNHIDAHLTLLWAYWPIIFRLYEAS